MFTTPNQLRTSGPCMESIAAAASKAAANKIEEAQPTYLVIPVLASCVQGAPRPPCSTQNAPHAGPAFKLRSVQCRHCSSQLVCNGAHGTGECVRVHGGCWTRLVLQPFTDRDSSCVTTRLTPPSGVCSTAAFTPGQMDLDCPGKKSADAGGCGAGCWPKTHASGLTCLWVDVLDQPLVRQASAVVLPRIPFDRTGQIQQCSTQTRKGCQQSTCRGIRPCWSPCPEWHKGPLTAPRNSSEGDPRSLASPSSRPRLWGGLGCGQLG